MRQDVWVESELEHELNVGLIPRNSVTSLCNSRNNLYQIFKSLRFLWKLLCHGSSGIVWKAASQDDQGALTTGTCLWDHLESLRTIASWRSFTEEVQQKELLLQLVKGICKWNWPFPLQVHRGKNTMSSRPTWFHCLGSKVSNIPNCACTTEVLTSPKHKGSLPPRRPALTLQTCANISKAQRCGPRKGQ